jgi:hypothetical protein
MIMSTDERPPSSQEQIVRQSSLNRATDLVTALINSDAKINDIEGYATQDVDVLRSLICGVARGFENWVQRPVVVPVVEKKDYAQYRKDSGVRIKDEGTKTPLSPPKKFVKVD